MRKHRAKWLAVTTGALLAGVTLAACGSSGGSTPNTSSGDSSGGGGSPEQSTTSVTLASSTQVTDPINMPGLGTAVAIKDGIFKQENIDLKVSITTGSPQTLAAVKSGSAQFGAVPLDVILSANAQGADIVVVGGQAISYPSVIVAQKNITDFSQLKGKTIAITSVGASSQTSVVAYAQSLGFKQSDFKFAPTRSVAGMQQELVGGQASASYLNSGDAAAFLAKYGDKVHILVPADVFGKVFADYGSAIFTTGAYAKAHPDVVTDFMKAQIQGNRKVAKDDGYFQQFVDKTNPGRFDANVMKNIVAAYQPTLGVNGGIAPDEIQADYEYWQKYVAANGGKDSDFTSWQSMFDPQYVQKAVTQLGGIMTGGVLETWPDAKVGGGDAL